MSAKTFMFYNTRTSKKKKKKKKNVYLILCDQFNPLSMHNKKEWATFQMQVEVFKKGWNINCHVWKPTVSVVILWQSFMHFMLM